MQKNGLILPQGAEITPFLEKVTLTLGQYNHLLGLICY